MSRRLLLAAAWVVAAAACRPAGAEDFLARGKAAFDAGRFEDAAEALKKHVDAYPEDLEGYRWLGFALENAGHDEEAIQAWKDFRTLAKTPRDVELADARLSPAGRLDKRRGAGEPTPEELAELSRVEPGWHEETTRHFTVRTHNPKLTKFIGRQAEHYLTLLCDRFLGGAAYPHKVPLTIYKDHAEYVAAGYPEWSGGGTIADYRSLDAFVSGRVEASIALFQLGRDGKLNPELSKPIVLPHELTHLVLSEHFGQTALPVWVNEGVAQLVQFDGRKRAEEALRPALEKNRQAGFPLRELVPSMSYPKNTEALGAFYYQSVSFLGWVQETCGDEKLRQFLTDLKKGRGAEAALKPLFPAVSGKDWLDQVHEQWVGSVLAGGK